MHSQSSARAPWMLLFAVMACDPDPHTGPDTGSGDSDRDSLDADSDSDSDTGATDGSDSADVSDSSDSSDSSDVSDVADVSDVSDSADVSDTGDPLDGCGDWEEDPGEACDAGPLNTDDPCLPGAGLVLCAACTTSCEIAYHRGLGSVFGAVHTLDAGDAGWEAGAEVWVAGRLAGTTDASGRFEVHGVVTGEDVTVRVRPVGHRGLAPASSEAYAIVYVGQDQSVWVDVHPQPACVIEPAGPTAPYQIRASDGDCTASGHQVGVLTAYDGDLVDAEGSAWAGGALRAHQAQLVFRDADGTPTPRAGLALPPTHLSLDSDGVEGQIAVLGASFLRLSDRDLGTPLGLAPGAELLEFVPVSRFIDGTEPARVYAFDEAVSRWRELGPATCGATSPDLVTGTQYPVCLAMRDRSGWIAVGLPGGALGCAVLTLSAADGPVGGGRLMSSGLGFGASQGVADAGGETCVAGIASTVAEVVGETPSGQVWRGQVALSGSAGCFARTDCALASLPPASQRERRCWRFELDDAGGAAFAERELHLWGARSASAPAGLPRRLPLGSATTDAAGVFELDAPADLRDVDLWLPDDAARCAARVLLPNTAPSGGCDPVPVTTVPCAAW